MENAEIVEPPEVPHIDGQQPLDAMHIHTRRQPGIMDLNALNLMDDNQKPPAVVNFPAVRQQLEITLDHLGQAIRLGNA